VPDLQAIGWRVGKASMGVAVVKNGMDYVQLLALEKSPVALRDHGVEGC
jgi:hypothetical protein